ncbi:MAG: hypothetical protein AB7K52_14215 [Phycisphaerales bacterium]
MVIRSSVVIAAVLGTLCTNALAQIKARVRHQNGTYVDVPNISVDSGGNVDLNTHQLASAAGCTNFNEPGCADFDVVWIYDTSALDGDPTRSIGPVTISIGLDTQNNPVIPREIRVIVARPPSAADPDPNSDNRLGDFVLHPRLNSVQFVGALDFRSLTVDPVLLPTTRVMLAVAGDVGIDPALNNGVRDTINVGQVYRIQANGRVEFDQVTQQFVFLGGDIHADITAIGEDEEGFAMPEPSCNNEAGNFVYPSRFAKGFDLIGQVRAGNSITGRIQAVHQDRGGCTGYVEVASIASVIVGPFPRAGSPGRIGDIIAEGEVGGPGDPAHGRIRSILCAGPIGKPSPEAPTNIRARSYIGEVRCIIEGATEPVDADINASIVAGASLDAFNDAGPDIDGVLNLIETGGDLEGEVRAFNLYSVPEPTTSSGLAGIVVRGVAKAPIIIGRTGIQSNIIARTFTAPIKVGHFFQGTIAAVGTEAGEGEIPFLSIGVPINEDDEPNLPDFGFPYSDLPIGFAGVQVAGFQPPPLPAAGSTVESWFSAAPIAGQAIDGLIRAESRIGELSIVRVTQLVSTLPNRLAFDRPRIEVPEITSLNLGFTSGANPNGQGMDSGVLWSGKLRFDEVTGAPFVLDSERYTVVTDAKIGCMGPIADVWITGAPVLDVSGWVAGEIHVPSLMADQIVRLRLALTDLENNLCNCLGTPQEESALCFLPPVLLSEQTPRGAFSWFGELGTVAEPLTGQGIANYGAVTVGEPTGLGGRVIIHGNNDVAQQVLTMWRGDVWIGIDDPPNALVCNTRRLPSDPLQAPQYTASKTLIGGGSIGLVPFHRHPIDDTPATSDGEPSSDSNFGSVTLQSFFAATPATSPVTVDLYGAGFDEGDLLDTLPPVAVDWRTRLGMFVGENAGSVIGSRFAVAFPEHRVALLPSGASFDGFPVGLFRVTTRIDSSQFQELRCGEVSGPSRPPAIWSDFHFFQIFPDCPQGATPPNGLPDENELRADKAADCNGNGQYDICDIINGFALDSNNDGRIDTCPGNCPADFNADGVINADDLGDFINCYFDEAATPGICPQADYNHDGFVDPDDLGDFINFYFSPVC